MTTANQKNPGASSTSSGITFLRRGEVLKRLGIRHSTLFEKIAEGVIPPPVPLPLGSKQRRPLSVWVESEITAFQERLIAARDEALADQPRRPPRERTASGTFAKAQSVDPPSANSPEVNQE
ncbi:MAG TPA: AlpA family phage regulatory protein [Blastocatellia bacterium]